MEGRVRLSPDSSGGEASKDTTYSWHRMSPGRLGCGLQKGPRELEPAGAEEGADPLLGPGGAGGGRGGSGKQCPPWSQMLTFSSSVIGHNINSYLEVIICLTGF